MGCLPGEWRVSEHGIFCGTLRIAKFCFDTEPSEEFKADVYEQMQAALNAEANSWAAAERAERE